MISIVVKTNVYHGDVPYLNVFYLTPSKKQNKPKVIIVQWGETATLHLLPKSHHDDLPICVDLSYHSIKQSYKKL